jgi:hypothetical protein
LPWIFPFSVLLEKILSDLPSSGVEAGDEIRSILPSIHDDVLEATRRQADYAKDQGQLAC